jgi:hypothetical protein
MDYEVAGDGHTALGTAVSSPEVIIFAPDRQKAQRAAELMEAAFILVQGSPDAPGRMFQAIPEDNCEFGEYQDEMIQRSEFESLGCCTPGLCLSAWIAAKASHKKHLV